MSHILSSKPWSHGLSHPARAGARTECIARPAPDGEITEQQRLDTEAFLLFGTVCEILEVCRVASLASGILWLLARVRRTAAPRLAER